jgi:hypothetical protein
VEIGMRQANQEAVLRHHKEIWSEGRLEIGDRECEAFCAAVEDFITSHRPLLSQI